MNKVLNEECKKTLQDLKIDDKVYWGDGVTNMVHVERCMSLGIDVPQKVIDYLKNDAVIFIDPPTEQEKEDIVTSMMNPKYDHKTGQLYYYDPFVKLNLSTQINESGFGINSGTNPPGSWMRRFNGMSMTNKSAMAHPYAICVTQLVCSVDYGNEGSYFDCLHYDMFGNDGRISGRLLFTEQSNQMGYATEGVRVIIPPFRRVTIRTGGNNISYPQGYYKYREVIDI